MEEVEWWSDDCEKVLGIVLFEFVDLEWLWMILGRDERGVFRWVDGNSSIESRDEASKQLQSKIGQWAGRDDVDFHQGDSIHKKNEIFIPTVSEEKLNPIFKVLAESEAYSSARELIKEIAYAFVDLDGNYVKDFQTTGISGRLWELYLFAFLYEQKFSITDDANRPDFYARKNGFKIAIEAVTVNPTDGRSAPSHSTTEERRELLKDYMPIKFGSVLFSKLKKKYWEMPEMREVPLVFAVHDFHADDSMTWSSTALHEYLYGFRGKSERDSEGNVIMIPEEIDEHVWEGKRIPSGFFRLEDAKHISAVIFSNSATVSKFNRIGKISGFGSPEIHMKRIGDMWNPDPKAALPIPFMFDVEPGSYEESWSEGIRVFHNPNALIPLPEDAFDGCSHHMVKDGVSHDYLPDRFVFNSKTFIIQPTGEGGD